MISILSLSGLTVAHGVEKHQGSTPTTTIDNIIYQMLVMAAIVGVFVYIVMFLALWKYRKGSKYKRNFGFTEHKRLEIVWIIIPTLIVIYLAYISGEALVVIEEPPDEGLRIEVIGHQWLWEFRYPDGNTTINDLYIQEHQTVILDVTSADVIHAFFVPEFNLKIDALPDVENTIWFVAEPAGEYTILCAEFCGNEHHAMLGKIIIYPASESPEPYGPPGGFDTEPGGGQPGAGRIIDVELWESGGTHPARPWSIYPDQIEVAEGEAVSLRVWNKGDGDHNLTIGWPYNLRTELIPPDEFVWLNFTADRATPSTAVWCGVPGHLDLGMEGFLIVGEPRDVSIDEHEEPDRQMQIITFSIVFLIFFLVLLIALRPGKRTKEVESGSGREEENTPGPRPASTEEEGELGGD